MTVQTTHFILVAPHAAGDDLRTGEIAKAMAEKLNAPAIINKTFIKPANSRASREPNKVEDFNKLPWRGNQYDWKRKKPEMKQFYDSILQVASKFPQAVVLFIHGFKSSTIAVDIGMGAKLVQGRLSGDPTGRNTGARKCPAEKTLQLQDAFSKQFPDLRITIGEENAAWSRLNGVQYVPSPHIAIQLELNQKLRERSNVETTADKLVKALLAVWS